MQIDLKSDHELVKKWGELAYVSEEDRRRILSLPFGQFKPAKEKLKKQIKAMKKEEAARKRFKLVPVLER